MYIYMVDLLNEDDHCVSCVVILNLPNCHSEWAQVALNV